MLTAVLAAAGVLAAPATAQPDGDAAVGVATSRLAQARDRAAHLTRSLDETASSYEQANAHRVRLQDELTAAGSRLRAADAAVVDAQETLGRQIAVAYMHPSGELVVADALLTAPDASSALHRAALYRRVASRGAEVVEQRRWVNSLTHTDVRQEAVIAAGAQASVDEWQRQARALTQALGSARRAVSDAEAGVAAAREEAARRAEAERRRLQEARQARQDARPDGPLPRVDGKVCPIGAPNGFIDSWGYPRSGGRSHEGVDMFAPYGTPQYAVADGVIHRVYTSSLGGLAVNLIDDDGNMYYYAHLASASVTTGQRVRAGDVIAATGDSGNARGTPPHLHWQYHPGNGAPVNPYPLAYALCR